MNAGFSGGKMTKISKSAAFGAIMCAGLTTASAEELRFDRLHIIGDSLSDGGTYSQAVRAGSRFTVPDIRYRWLTNAPDGSSLTYGEVLARSLGITLNPNVISGIPGFLPEIAVGGSNYAEGGSRVALQPGIGNDASIGITTLPLTTQVDRLLTANPTLNANDLVILWGGANDVFFQSDAVRLGLPPAVALANMAQAADDLVAQVARVKAASA